MNATLPSLLILVICWTLIIAASLRKSIAEERFAAKIGLCGALVGFCLLAIGNDPELLQRFAQFVGDIAVTIEQILDKTADIHWEL